MPGAHLARPGLVSVLQANLGQGRRITLSSNGSPPFALFWHLMCAAALQRSLHPQAFHIVAHH